MAGVKPGHDVDWGVRVRLSDVGRMDAPLADRDGFASAAQPPRHELVERGR